MCCGGAMRQLWQRLTGGSGGDDGVGPNDNNSNNGAVTDAERRKDMISCFEKYSKVGGFRTAVDHISSRELAALPRDSYVVVDCRPDRERQVSRIPGSISQEEFEAKMEKEEQNTATTSKADKKLVVTSCTIGYRSGKFAKQLVARAKREAKREAKAKARPRRKE